MAKIGLNNLFYAILTEGASETYSYGGAKSFGKAINCNVSISNNSAKLYADDSLAESDTSFQSGTVSLGVDDDRDTVFAEVLGHTIDASGEVVCNVNDTAPYVGLGRIVVKMVNNVRLYKAEILYKVKFGEPSQDDQTRGESLEFSTPTIEGQVSALLNREKSPAYAGTLVSVRAEDNTKINLGDNNEPENIETIDETVKAQEEAIAEAVAEAVSEVRADSEPEALAEGNTTDTKSFDNSKYKNIIAELKTMRDSVTKK